MCIEVLLDSSPSVDFFFLLFLNKTYSVSTPTEFISQGRRQILGLKQHDEGNNMDDTNNNAVFAKCFLSFNYYA